MEEFLDMDLNGDKKVLESITFYPLPINSVYRSFKVMPRNAFSKAFVGAAFNVEFLPSSTTVTGSPILAFTGLSSTFVRNLKCFGFIFSFWFS